MKNIPSVVTKIIMGIVLVVALATNVIAQPTLPPNTNTYTGGTNGINWAAITNAEEMDYSNNYAPWAIQDIILPGGGGQITSDALEYQTVANLLTLSTNIAAAQVAGQMAVSNLLLTQTISIPQTFTNTQGDLFYFDHTNPDGSAAVKMTSNLESEQTVGAQKLWPGGTSGFNINGTNVLMAQWDGGDVLTNHQEFTNGYRVYLLDGPTSLGVQDHPTHVAGTMTAYGVNGTAIGFANRARLTESYYGNDVAEMPVVAATLGVRESNHSYGYAAGWAGLVSASGTLYYIWYGNPAISAESWIFGFYDGPGAATNDSIIYNAQTYVSVFAAGNAPGYTPPPTQPVLHVEYINGTYYYSTETHPVNGTTNGFDTLTGDSCSKNDVVVGAVNVNTNGYTGTNATTIAFFSSLGPTADGRIKPDVVAPGVNIFSSVAESNNAYTTMSGTSMAAPAVTGTLGLITSYYQKLYPTTGPLLVGSNAPLASTLRGLLIHTADQLGTNVGPSYTYGWGMIDPVAAITLITNNYASGSLANIKEVRINNGDYVQFPVVLTNNSPFKATITWTDPPGTPVAPAINPTNHMLVNDLDLRMISPGGITNYPWVLNPNLPANAATTGDNNLDNVEQVYIPNPTNGVYQLRITNKGSLVDNMGATNSQSVSILLSGNLALPPTLPKISSFSDLIVSNTVAIKWASDVGRIYRVQANTSLSTTNWNYLTGELSATKTNTAAVLYAGGVNVQFYRVVQVR